MKCGSLQRLKVHCFSFMLGSALLLLFLLGIYHQLNNQVYLVLLDGREMGVVGDPQTLDIFIEDLTVRCGELYELDLEIAEELTLVKEFMPDVNPDPEAVQDKIRQQASFLTAAYMINVDGATFVPVSSACELDEVVKLLKKEYTDHGSTARVVDVVLVEELTLEECIVPLEEIFTAVDVVELLTSDAVEEAVQMTAASKPELRGSLSSRYSSEGNYITDSKIALAEGILKEQAWETAAGDFTIHVRTVEEVVVKEAIPFPVEQLHDENMPVTQSEINVSGVDGEKRIVYQVVRENGVEVERTVISEEILEEPQVQVETVGLAEPPAIGSGKFVWPVQGEGIIYNGYSARHTGIDIHIDYGTNVLAADAGLVTYSGYGGTQGNYLIIYHGAYWTLYLHNSVNLVSAGDRVSRGQVIAKVGATGRAYGAHLHFEVRKDDGTGQWLSYYQHQPVNPLKFFNRR